MDTGEKTMKAALDQLQELGLKTMAASLEDFYNSPDFNITGRLELISRIIGDEYDARMTSRYEGRLRKAKLKGCACSLDKCVDTKERQYQPDEIVKTLSRMQFVKDGMNLFILGPSDSGKTYLAKALGIAACRDYRVLYYHCEELSADLSDLRKHDYDKYKRELKKLSTIDLLILDDFLLHPMSDDTEIEVLYTVLEHRNEAQKSCIICSQREPKSWPSMVMQDEVSSNSLLKRITKNYTVMIQRSVDDH